MPASIISKNSDKKRLRLVLLLFFLALAIPTLFLVRQAYSQLKWEAFHQHRLLAEELAARIDRRLNELVQAEEARAFTDYTFLVVAGDPAANFLQRSPLSAYPPAADIPGLVGYFQIDDKDVFSSPLLPLSDAQVPAYGIDAQQLAARRSLQGHIRQILSENHLVQSKKPLQAPAAAALQEEMARTREAEAKALERQAEFTSKKDLASAAVARRDDNAAEEDRQQPYAGLSSPAPAAPSAEAPASAREESYSNVGGAVQTTDEAAAESPSQAAFDRLSVAESKQSARSSARNSSDLRVEDLKLNDDYEQKAKTAPQSLSKNGLELPQRAARKERSVLPEPLNAKAEAIGALQSRNNAEVKINIFESELDPFEISLLDSGHFILFRKVWRNDHRYIQGALIEQKPFISGVIETLFRETALSQATNLAVGYGGEVTNFFAGANLRSYSEFGDTLLYRTHLSAPFTGLELIFSINHLPTGPGGRVVGWVACIIMLVLCGGSWLMYRLGLRQISLVNQQQDFVSAVSHELKTPLTSIRMYGEMLKQGWVDENKRKTYYDFIFDESERLTRLINNVLQLARLTRNDFEINSRTVSIGELLDTVRSKIASQIERAGFSLNINADDSARAAAVEIDVDIFTQILINLVDNALKFSARAETRTIDIGVRLQSDGTALISVRDYGPGIPRNQMTRIFRLFYRSGSELTRETAGTGIGLALVRQLTLAMRGQVDVLNREPGAEFRLVFPIAGSPR
ncbi:MAG TPA: HAMP domain-containing sensor histidine kinase [Gammaproteobacteria bacterium]|nr:HAMP domain-containing sensor histidine kinase [Gammaproteobacteria bacterium]